MAVREERVRNSGALSQTHKAWVAWNRRAPMGVYWLWDVCDFLVYVTREEPWAPRLRASREDASGDHQGVPPHSKLKMRISLRSLRETGNEKRDQGLNVAGKRISF